MRQEVAAPLGVSCGWLIGAGRSMGRGPGARPPYSDLVGREVSVRRVSFKRMLLRALLKRCPRCGGRAWFTGWFAKADRCRTCGYRWERQEGFSLGAVTVNIIVTFGLIGATLLIGSIVTYPDIAVIPIVGIAVAIAIAVPIVFYPWSNTIWAAIDLAMRPLEPAEVADAAAHAPSAPTAA
jgi:uncharacterized protein (DUF983 family)